MLKLSIAAGLLAFSAASVQAQAATPDPSGTWLRGDGNARVRIAPCGDNVCATNLWIKDTSKGENVGDQLVMTVRPTDGVTLAGKAYDVKRKQTYSIRIMVKKSGLVTRGCIVGGLLCKDVSWSRASD